MTQVEIILLSLLYEKSYYGYEIESIIERRHMREWTKIGFSSIYNSLNKLEKKGLIVSRFEKEYGSPKRKVYSIKENAKTFVHERIEQMLHSPERVYSEFPIGMVFSYLLAKEGPMSPRNRAFSITEARELLDLKNIIAAAIYNNAKEYLNLPIQNFTKIAPMWTGVSKLICRAGENADEQPLGEASDLLMEIACLEETSMKMLLDRRIVETIS